MNVQFTVHVPKTPDLDRMVERLTGKLDRLLAVFQPELVQLHGRLVRRTSREGVVCTLNLRLPTGQLAAEDSANTAQAALRIASEELLEQLKKHKQKLRGEPARRGRQRSTAAFAAPLATPEPVPAAYQQQRRQDLARYISTNFEHLQRFVERQIHLREHLGELRPGQLETAEVLDEMIASALSEQGNPERIERDRWFYLLAVDAIRRLSRPDEAAEGSFSLDGEVTPDAVAESERFEFFQPDDEVQLQDVTPDRAMATPEEIAYSNEMLSLLESALGRLSPQHREDFVLFALEGFTLRELSVLSQRPATEVYHGLVEARRELGLQGDLPGELRHLLVEQTQQRLSRTA
jgi:DNA-directed RNA polymerase specialized sigma24 family protein/ribosome-associated translation inhibitor RaiA